MQWQCEFFFHRRRWNGIIKQGKRVEMWKCLAPPTLCLICMNSCRRNKQKNKWSDSKLNAGPKNGKKNSKHNWQTNNSAIKKEENERTNDTRIAMKAVVFWLLIVIASQAVWLRHFVRLSAWYSAVDFSLIFHFMQIKNDIRWEMNSRKHFRENWRHTKCSFYLECGILSSETWKSSFYCFKRIRDTFGEISQTKNPGIY